MIQEKAMEDLETIKSFLEEGKARLEDSGSFFIYWGLAIPLSTALFYLLMKLSVPVVVLQWFWPALIPLHVIANMLMGKRRERRQEKRDFLTRINSALWMGILFTFIANMGIYILMKDGMTPAIMSFVALLLGLAYWVHGSMLKMKWLAFQGFIWWSVALAISRMGWNGASLMLSGTTFICSFGTGIILKLSKRRA